MKTCGGWCDGESEKERLMGELGETVNLSPCLFLSLPLSLLTLSLLGSKDRAMCLRGRERLREAGGGDVAGSGGRGEHGSGGGGRGEGRR